MKQHRRLAVLSIIILIALVSVNTVYAQPPIGSTTQSRPFESSPTTHATDKAGAMGGVTNPGNAYDTDWSGTSATVPLAGNAPLPPPGDQGVHYLEFSAFDTADPTEFYADPDWIAIKIRYSCPATTDDQYKIIYQVAPDLTWYVLQDWVSGSAAAVAIAADIIAQDWPNVAEPNDGTWDWTDVSNLKVRINTQMVGANDGKPITLYEVWATVYPAPEPPMSSTAISIQPSVVMDARPGDTFFVDVVVAGLTPPPGLQVYTINIDYDTTQLTATEIYTYNPFKTKVSSGIDDLAGKVSISYITYFGDSVGFLGENTSLTRIYFVADAGGTSDLSITFGELKDIGVPTPYYPPTYDGWASVDRVLSLVTGQTPPPEPMWIDPITAPLTTWWHEIHPTYSQMWHLTSWEDTQLFGEPGYGELSKCDQIDMTLDGTGEPVWYHVDLVTVTVHYEFKEGAIDGSLTGEVGAAEPRGYPEWFVNPWDPYADPTYGGLHEIYPEISRPSYISVWQDTDESGTLTPSDQIEIYYLDDFTQAWAHVTGISTDIYVSEKPPVPAVPEFPLGISLLMLLAPIIPLTYLWRLRRKVPKQ